MFTHESVLTRPGHSAAVSWVWLVCQDWLPEMGLKKMKEMACRFFQNHINLWTEYWKVRFPKGELFSITGSTVISGMAEDNYQNNWKFYSLKCFSFGESIWQRKPQTHNSKVMHTCIHNLDKINILGLSLVVQWLGIHLPMQGDAGLLLLGGTKIPHGELKSHMPQGNYAYAANYRVHTPWSPCDN